MVGYTPEGRPLYIAKLGSGPERMWIQGRIHGDEPYGNDACLEIIKSLLGSGRRILEEMTFWIIPSYNPDGSEHFWRRNANRIDLNRNWWRTGGTGYSEPESIAFYWAWVEFRPHYAIDIHHQGTYFVEDEDGNDTNQMTAFSIGISVRQEFLEPWIWDVSRGMAVVGYDAVSKLGFCNPSRYPLVNIHSAVVSSMMLGNPGPDGHDAGWKTAAMFFENRGGIGNKSRGYIIKQNVVAVHAIIDAIAYGELTFVEEERWDEIPDRGGRIRDSDKWPNEWAELDPRTHPDYDAGTVHDEMTAVDDAGNESDPAGPGTVTAITPTIPRTFALYQNVPSTSRCSGRPWNGRHSRRGS
ncbi:MAG: M14 family zinc carboxypeptidase [Candidatus Krumholzibacteria bacterium]|nr:M14 family zinc carboxypeptidase [Candidatus Krumholzibacteria bacterium]